MRTAVGGCTHISPRSPHHTRLQPTPPLLPVQGLKGGAARYASWLLSATAGYRMQPPGCCRGAACAGGCSGSSSPVAASELGPPTPDEHSPDPSDASSDDMSAEMPFILGMREVEGTPASGAGGLAAGQPLQQQHEQHAQWPQQDGLQAFATHFSSQCEHHLLPFYGTLRLAYLPGGAGSASAACDPACLRRQLGRIVEMFARRLQVQERLTHQVADAGALLLRVLGGKGERTVCLIVNGGRQAAGLDCDKSRPLQISLQATGCCCTCILPCSSPTTDNLAPSSRHENILPRSAASRASVPSAAPHLAAPLPHPPLAATAAMSALGARAVLVAVESAHMCMVARGVEKHASTTLTTAARGEWEADAAARAAALEALVDPAQHALR